MADSSDITITAVDIGKQLQVFQDPARLDKIVAHVTCGGSLTDLCKLWSMTGAGTPQQLYVQTRAWLRADPVRKAAYDQALKDREEWMFERVLSIFQAISEFDLSDVQNDDGSFKARAEWPRAASLCVKSFDVLELPDGSGVMKRMVMWDKNKTLESIGKHLAMFSREVAVDESESWAKMVEESFKDE